jgi:hypothetical protein
MSIVSTPPLKGRTGKVVYIALPELRVVLFDGRLKTCSEKI